MAHLRAIADAFPADAVVFTARDAGERLVGGVLGVFHRGELFLRMSGFAAGVTRDGAAYFNLAYHLPLEYRRQRPHRRVHHGLGSLVTKHRPGAQLTPVWTLLPDPLPDPLAEQANRQRTGTLTRGLPADVVESLWADVVRIAARRAAP